MKCAKYTNSNPIDPLYHGDYSLTLTPFPGTEQEIFTPYTRTYATGKDTFELIEIASPTSILDTTLFEDMLTDSTITLYFTQPYQGTVTITGTRPNQRTDSAAITVNIVNPYRIAGDSLYSVGDKIAVQLRKYTESVDPNKSFSVEWSVDGAVIDTSLQS
ncbi:MAG: hypothetical protein GF401_07125, partial [Chitinivibrionales bacterium]|nr:hypothetical protein [Chitinivibrionales bacterium]